MTTPITTPSAKEVTNKVRVTTPAPVVDIENEESLNVNYWSWSRNSNFIGD